jgi:hypothetical protein
VPTDLAVGLAAFVFAPGDLLGRERQDRLNRRPARRVDQLVHGHLGLGDQVQHGQQELALPGQKLRQLPTVPAIDNLIRWLHGGSFPLKLTNRILTDSADRNRHPFSNLQLPMGHPHLG